VLDADATLSSLTIGGSPHRRRLPTGALELDVWLRSTAAPRAGWLDARLLDQDERELATQRLAVADASEFAAALHFAEPSDEVAALELSLRAADERELTAPARVELDLHGTSLLWRGDAAHAIELAQACADGRWLLAGAGGLSVLLPGEAPQLLHRFVAEVTPSFQADARCSQVLALAAGELVAVETHNQELRFSAHLDEAVAVLADANPRYSLVVERDGALRRFYRRDSEWSKYRGRLDAPPAVDAQGRLVWTRSAERVLVASTAPSLCALRDEKKLEPHCVPIAAPARALALMPFGFADPAPVARDHARAAERFVADEAKRELEAWGQAVVLLEDGRLQLVALQDGSVLSELPQQAAALQDPTEFGPDPTATSVVAVGAESLAVRSAAGVRYWHPYAPSESSAPPKRASGGASEHSLEPVSGRWAELEGDALFVYDEQGVRLALVGTEAGAERAEALVFWADDAVLVARASRLSLSSLDGVTSFVREDDPEPAAPAVQP